MFRIPCPECGKSLKVRDASHIGRKAKCPGCSHRFVLTRPQEEPDEVELELIDPTPAPPPTVMKQPLTGTSARWIPDEPAAVASTETAVAQAAVGIMPAQTAADTIRFPLDSEPTSPVSKIRQRNQKRGRTGLIVSLVGVLLTGGVGAAAYFLGIGAAEESGESGKVVANEAWQQEKQDLQAAATNAQKVSPTDGKPIDLKYLPPGANIVVHLRPSEIFSDDDARRELVFGLGPLGIWLENKVREFSQFEPKEVEQLTIAIGLGPRESEPEISAVVRLHEAQQRSVLIRQRFKGQRDPEFTEDIYVGEKYAWLLIDEKTFSMGPALLAPDLVASMQFAADPSDDLRLLIDETDRDRHVTVLFDTSALAIHTPTLFDESLQTAMVQVTDWLGKDVDAVAMSTHLGDQLFLETLLRNGTGTTSARLHRNVRARLAELPTDVLDMVRFMRPRRVGRRKVIARFPAMIQAVSLATDSGIGNRFVQLTTMLPERAIPNLAVGTVLTWDESTRTDFNRARTSTTKQEKKLPDTLAERLKLKTEVEFARTPLYEAVAMLGEDTGITFVLDGDGLKLAGYTQNMAQNVKLGEVSVAEGLKAILKQYDKMVLVADEARKTIKVTTKDSVAESGEKVLELD